MTPMAAECSYDKCSTYIIGYLETSSIGMNMLKQIVLTLIYVFIKIVDKDVNPGYEECRRST